MDFLIQLKKIKNNRGFTLVELMVSVAITSIIMLGISIFFAGTFRQMFQVQEETSGSQNHFAAMEVLRAKMEKTQKLLEADTDSMMIQNDLSKKELPFSYIGLSNGRLVFKDFFIFNGFINGLSTHTAGETNAAGGAYLNESYYIAVPSKNSIYQCNSPNDCEVFLNEGLNHPTDISTNGTDRLFVSDSGNHRVIEISDVGGANILTTLTEVKSSFPTGIVYYQDESGDRYVFFSDSYNNQIKRIALDDENKVINVMGNGDNINCNGSAFYCQLNFPTGLHLDSAQQTLYIADTGNNRVLKMSEPELRANMQTDLELNINLNDHYALHHVQLNGPFEGGSYNAASSTLISRPPDYDSVLKQFNSATQIPLTISDFGDCVNNVNNLYIQSIPEGYTLAAGDILRIEGENVTITDFFEDIACAETGGEEGEEVINETRDHLEIETVETLFNNGDEAYFSHPLDVIFVLENLQFTQSGFRKVGIELFDANDPLVPIESRTFAFRIGNGTLGTEEDQVEVLITDLNYPTGLSVDSETLLVANSLNEEILNFDLNGTPLPSISPLIPFSIESFPAFDYQSEFLLQSLEFNELNNGNLLQMKADIQMADGRTENYQFTTYIP